jgi:hypothetical protein
MELAYILVPIFLFVLIRGLVEQRAKERQARLQLLEQALKNPAIDRATITSLAQQLTGARPPSAKPARGLAWLLALGWLTLFSGLGVWVLGIMLGNEGVQASGLLVSLIGFGFVTYPFALRELEARRPAG